MQTPIRSSLTTVVLLTLLTQSLSAQTVAPAPRPTVPLPDETITLSPFVVEESEDRGYAATSTLAGTRLRTDLRDVGAAISVVTAQFMADTASTNVRDLLVYTTNTEAGGFEGNFSGVDTGNRFSSAESTLQNPQNSTRVRGLAGADLTRDFFLTNIPMDSYNTERVDISRGANAILFGLGSPAGIINNQLKSANLNKNAYSFQQTWGRFDSHREILDVNQSIAKGILGVRVIGLNKSDKYRQKPAYEDDRRIYTSIKWEPRLIKTGLTQFQVNYEGGKTTSNRPRPTPPQDGLTAWYSVLNKVAIDPTVPTSVTNNPFLFAHLGAPGRWFGQIGAVFTDPASATQGGNGVPPFMISRGGVPFTSMYAVGAYAAQGNNPNFFLNQQFAPAGQAFAGLWRYQELRDPSTFNFYDTLLDGPNKREASDFRALNATFRQTFFRDLVGFELAYDRQTHNRDNFGMFGFDAYTLFVDINSKLVDGAPNPNFGRPYVASDSIGNNFVESKREAKRATVYATLDLRKKDGLLRHLGRHTFTGTYTDQESSSFNRSINGYSYGLEANVYANNPTATTYPAYAAVHYLGGSIAGLNSPAGANIAGITAVHTPQASGTALLFDARTNQMVRVPVTTISASERDISKLYSGASKNLNTTKSKSAVWQGYLFSDKLVGLVGWREDEFDLRDAGPARLASVTGETDPYNPAWTLPATPTIYAKDSTLSWSGVLHAPGFVKRWLPRGTDFSVSYNQAQNFRPSSTIADVYGRPFSPPSGKTKDTGITISALDQKFVLRVNRYRTTQANDSATFYNTFWPGNDVVRAMNGMRQSNVSEVVINKWFGFSPNDPRYLPLRAGLTNPAQAANLNPALTAAETTFRNTWFTQRTREEWLRPVDPLLASSWNFTQAANGGTWSATRPPNVGNVADTVSEGWEFEGTFNPTKSWRITYNAAMQEARKSNVGADFTEFIKKNLPLWTDGNGRLATNIRDMEGLEDITYFNSFGTSQLGNLAILNMYVPYLNALAANGSPVQELRRWRFNVVTNYDFRSGKLKGWSVGGAARWQDKVAIGFPAKQNEAGAWVYDVSKPYYGSDEINYDFWLRYGRKIFNDKIGWRVQLNVRDIFGGEDLIAVSAQPNGQVASARIPQPNKWTITNTFEF
ncbi:TonB-dependent receptor plug domain-containing protein [Horticoccus sp. 23ND18S-11]|uniref:TonB-dependent receptor plug domain-containing protein n=1 Tax=Horticoccus sp. 23ND18S-11 TaxID=3391832 RepID=UPI0039C95370